MATNAALNRILKRQRDARKRADKESQRYCQEQAVLEAKRLDVVGHCSFLYVEEEDSPCIWHRCKCHHAPLDTAVEFMPSGKWTRPCTYVWRGECEMGVMPGEMADGE